MPGTGPEIQSMATGTPESVPPKSNFKTPDLTSSLSAEVPFLALDRTPVETGRAGGGVKRWLR